ncbi:MAG: sulfurtransferase TusA family protein [Pedococcus sp.]
MTAEPPVGTDVVVVDARGLRCPLPVIRLAQRVRGLGEGTLVEVWATDPAAAADIPAWCRMRGQEYVTAHGPEAAGDGAHTAYLVRVVATG